MSASDKPIEDIVRALQERAKELNCLYRVDEILSQTSADRDAMTREMLETLPAGWQVPHASQAKLVLDGRIYKSDGYVFTPDDPNLTYSTRESGLLQFPHRILPVGSEDSPDNFLNLSGAPVQITYEKADVVRLIQEFLDSPQDRVTTANMLARHFLPAYVSYDATYVGGSVASTIAKDIISIIDTVAVESPLDISVLEEAITKRGGNPITPTKAMVVLHDWNRKVWLEFSENEVGGTQTRVPYAGTPRVASFRPGPDVSGQEDPASGERINLVRR